MAHQTINVELVLLVKVLQTKVQKVFKNVESKLLFVVCQNDNHFENELN